MKPSNLILLFVGLVAGAAASWPLFFYVIDQSGPEVYSWFKVILLVVGIVGAAMVLALPLAWWAVRRFLGTARGTLEQVITDSTAAAHCMSARDADGTARHVQSAALELLAWYAPIAARRWVAQTSIALLVGFGGLIGTALLLRQTLLLGEQNKKLEEQTFLLRDQNLKLDMQTITAEAQRRSTLATELFSILQQLPAEENSEPSSDLRLLPRSIAARIIAFSRAATPYWTIDVPAAGIQATSTISPRIGQYRTSPERGQLLTALLMSNVDVTKLSQAGALFISAGLQDAMLVGARLPGTNLDLAFMPGVVLSGAVLTGANFAEAQLPFAQLNAADLSRSNMHRANLCRAILGGADLSGSNLTGTNFRGAALVGVNFSGAVLRGADLSGAFLNGANLSGADLREAQLIGIDLDDVNVGIRDPTGARPTGFPEGWTTAPDGWEVFFREDRAFLRRTSREPLSLQIVSCAR